MQAAGRVTLHHKNRQMRFFAPSLRFRGRLKITLATVFRKRHGQNYTSASRQATVIKPAPALAVSPVSVPSLNLLGTCLYMAYTLRDRRLGFSLDSASSSQA